MTEDPATSRNIARDRARYGRDLAIGFGTVVFLLWITFFSAAGAVEIATLAVAVAMLIWFATVEPNRLTDGTRTPNAMLFLLALMACAFVLAAALIIGTGTLFFVTLVTCSAVVVGFVRAMGHRYRQKPETDDGIL